jgi:hypothetical protein
MKHFIIYGANNDVMRVKRSWFDRALLQNPFSDLLRFREEDTGSVIYIARHWIIKVKEVSAEDAKSA